MTRATGSSPKAFELRVLGRIELEKDGRSVQSILAQPKRLGLLVYLALRRPNGFITRDELLGVFWPESPESRARASLRQSLRFLRKHLGREGLINRGGAEVGIPAAAMNCDALRFLKAGQEGDDAQAMGAYAGELLPGFILAGAYEFDRWLQAERRALRVLAVQAAMREARHAESAGRVGPAVEAVRWALRLDPTDEATARHLISLHVRSGNRGAAAGTYAALVRRLRLELDLDPSAQTIELMTSLRESGREEVGPGSGSGAATDLDPLSSERVLVLPLEVFETNSGLKPIARLAADIVAQRLVTIPELEVVPPVAVFGAFESEGQRGSRRGEGEEGAGQARITLARRMKAGTLVEGTCQVEGGRLHLRPRIIDVSRGRLLELPEPVVGSLSDPLPALVKFGDGVAATLAPILSRRVVHVRQAVRPPSVAAYSAYIQGLERFIRGEWRDALAHFHRVVDQEPSYVLPQIVGAITHWNLMELGKAQAIARRANEMRGALGRFEQALLDMILAWLDGDWLAAHTAVCEQANLAPGSIPHFQVAEEARRLNRLREAREVLLELDPQSGELEGWVFYWIELTLVHHLLGDHRSELEVASHYRRLQPNDPVGVLLELRALVALGRQEDLVRVLNRAMAMPGRKEPSQGWILMEVALELQSHDQEDAAGPMFDRVVEWYEKRVDGDAPARMRREKARALYYAGQLQEARILFEQLFRAGGAGVAPVGYHHGHLQAHLDAGYLAVIAARGEDVEETQRWCHHLETLDLPFLYGAQWFWLAAVAAVRDESEAAVHLLRRAFAEGLPVEGFIHTDPHLSRLSGFEPFDDLMRPNV